MYGRTQEIDRSIGPNAERWINSRYIYTNFQLNCCIDLWPDLIQGWADWDAHLELILKIVGEKN